MAIRKQNRCPACGNVVDVASMVFSAASQTFVCPSCLRAGIRPPVDQPAPTVASVGEVAAIASTTATIAEPDDALAMLRAMSPSPSRVEQSLDDLSLLTPPAPPTAMTTLAPPRAPLPAWAAPAGALIAAALVITTIAIFFVARGKPAVDPRRAWEEANRAQIVALKSRAEELTIQKKLPEAHAKYRELEALVGGHTIGDPRLFDLVDQARLDQSRVYRMIMHSMSPAAVDAGPLPSTVETQRQQQPPQAAQTSQRPVAKSPSAAAAALTPASAPPPTDPASAPPSAATPAPAATQFAPTTTSAEPMPFTGPRSFNGITDAQVEQAIRHGVDFLVAQIQDGQLVRSNESDAEHRGLNALVVYALLQSSRAIRDERLGINGELLTKCIEQLKNNPLDGTGEDPPTTYAHSLRASALATYNRPQDRTALTEDVKWLINAAVEGTYTYDDRFAPRRPPPSDATGKSRGGAKVTRMDLAALRPPMMLAHGGEVMLPPPGPPLPVVTRPRTPYIPPPPGYVAPPTPYQHVPIYQLPEPGYRGKLPPPTANVPWDNSNSQYGVLGVWAGAEVGIEVPQKYWQDVRDHWRRAQLPSGQWPYAPGFDGSYSMTVGGIATLLIAHDYLEAPLLGSKTAGRKPYDDFITAGLAFLEHGNNVMDITQMSDRQLYYTGYNLFGLERVGLASGLKYIGVNDWYVELTAKMLPLQHPNGAWGSADRGRGAVIDTAYMLLFLSRGRHPVMMNKLRFDGFWTNRPRDAANLAAYASREMERPVNWQVVDIDHGADDWADSPILYIASNAAPKLGPDDANKIRQFVEAGGLLFTHADQGSDAFSAWAAKLAKEIFPGQALENLSPQHSLYSVNYKIENPRPRLQAVDNGVRLLMIHSLTDLANAWQVRASESRKLPFQVGVNLYLYATGKEQFRNRLDTRAIPDPPQGPALTYEIAQVKYDGNWNPEPGAWPRFAKSFQNNTGKRLVLYTATPAELDVQKYMMAVMTGANARTPSDEELAPTAKYVRDGGLLLVDACGGSGAFANRIEDWLARLDPAAKLEPMPPDDEFLKPSPDAGSIDLGPERLRLYATQQLGPNGARLKTMKLGKGRVIFTPLDYTSGLMGTNTWGILGYTPEYSEQLATNVVKVMTTKLVK
ncbi:MAG: hypothetical protein QOF78_4509 [Phycisphaerales bacterium]|jgi:hypothetical protein|nr:hypothetical protein [Phycisphaerales bacterium]